MVQLTDPAFFFASPSHPAAMPQLPVLETAELPSDAVEVGRITDAWGVKGWFKVLPYSSNPEALLAAKSWLLQPAEKGAKSFFAGTVLLPIRQARTHSDSVVAWAQGVDDRDAAEALRGARIFVPRANFPAAGDDEYYWVDLEGLDVKTTEGVALGQVSHLFSTGANDVVVVRGDRERMIPFVQPDFVKSVDFEANLVVVDWDPEF